MWTRGDGRRLTLTRAILGVGALLAAAVALAGCGGTGSASGTTGGVAGAERAQGNVRASIHGLAARVQTSVQAFQSGNLSSAVASGAPLLAQCQSVVNGKLSTRAKSPRQQQAVVHMQIACNDMSRAASARVNGNVTKAKLLARQALAQARLAARLSG